MLKLLRGAELSQEITLYKSELSTAERQIMAAMPADAADFDTQFDSDLDASDIAYSLAIGLVGVFISTNADIEKWLASVHDAASGKKGEYSVIQQMLGFLLFHQGDALDVFKSGEGFVARNGEKAYVMFHRLLFGHDVLATGKGLMPFNPFALMFEQQGLAGVLQAARHLIADTMSKQGLPVPGSSYFDIDREDGKPWNKIIDWVQDLSIESCGDKKLQQDIYSHMFTIRAQDIAAGGLVAVLDNAYYLARRIDDPIRKAQIELVSTSVAFFGQAAAGASRQNGVPYINNAMVPQLAKAYVGLFVSSMKRTCQLREKTKELCHSADEQIARHELISEQLHSSLDSLDSSNAAANVSKLINYLED